MLVQNTVMKIRNNKFANRIKRIVSNELFKSFLNFLGLSKIWKFFAECIDSNFDSISWGKFLITNSLGKVDEIFLNFIAKFQFLGNRYNF